MDGLEYGRLARAVIDQKDDLMNEWEWLSKRILPRSRDVLRQLKTLPEISSGKIALRRAKLCIRWWALLLRMSLHPARNGSSLKIRVLRSPTRMRIGTGMPRMLL